MTTTNSELDRAVFEAKVNMDQAHAKWMNTPVHAPGAEQVRAAKDAACNAYSDALLRRARAGGRGWPSWREVSAGPVLNWA